MLIGWAPQAPTFFAPSGQCEDKWISAVGAPGQP